MDDIDREIDSIMEEVENLDVRDQVNQLLSGHEDQHIFSQKNMFQGYINSSMDQITRDDPYIVVYDHSPGFSEGETGYGRVRGVGDTGYLPLEVQSSEALPNPRYEGSGFLEIAVEHDDIKVEEDGLATLQVVPYDPEKLASDSWREVLDSYDAENSDIRHRDLT